MDTVYIKEIISAIKAELIRFRFAFAFTFIGLSFLILVLGAVWPKSYVTSSILVAEVTKIIDPMIKGGSDASRLDKSEQAKMVIYTRKILEEVATKTDLITATMTPEEKDKAIKKIRSNLVVMPDKNNYFRISYSATNPDTSFDVLNTIINVFIADAEKKKREESAASYNFSAAQVQSYKHQLEQAEEKLKDFNSINLDGNKESVTARLNQIHSDIESLKITIEESQSKVNTLHSQLDAEGQYQHAKGQLDEMKQRRTLISTTLEKLLLEYKDDYPDVVTLRSQLAALNEAIAKAETNKEVYSGSNEKIENPLYEEIRKQLSNAELELHSQKRRMESLQNLQEQEQERAQRVAANQAQLSELNRDYNVTRDVYEKMLQQRENARLSMTLDSEGQGVNYHIQEPASFPIKPTGLDFIHFAIAGPFLAFLFPFGLLVFFVLVDPHIRSARALQNQLPQDIEILGVIPHFNTPLGERLIRKDMVALLSIATLSLVVYVSVATYWQIFKA